MDKIIVKVKCKGSKDVFDLEIMSEQGRFKSIKSHSLPNPDFSFFTRFDDLRNSWANKKTIHRDFFEIYQEDKALFGKELSHILFSSVKSEWEKIITSHTGRYVFQVDPRFWILPLELIFSFNKGQTEKYLDTLQTPILRQVDENPQKSKTFFLEKPIVYFAGADPIDSPTRAEEQLHSLKSQIPNNFIGKVLRECKPPQGNNDSQWDRISSDLLRYRPEIFHIVGHGQGARGITLEGETRFSEPYLLTYETLVEHLISVGSVRLLIIAACGSNDFFAKNAELAKKVFSETAIQAVVVMASDISAEAIIKFTELFYKALWYRADVASAIAYVRDLFRNKQNKLISLQWSVPVYYQSSPVNPYNNLIKKSNNTVVVQPLPFDRLENALENAKVMQQALLSLIEQGQLLTPSQCKVSFHRKRLLLARKYFDENLSYFDQNYSFEDDMLINSIRNISSDVLLTIDRFIKSINRGFIPEDTGVLDASVLLEESLAEAKDLVMINVSEQFQNWISA